MLVERLVEGCQGGVGHLSVLCWLGRPFRGLARSHRSSTHFEFCAVPVGAGMPAKRPALSTHSYRPCAVWPTAYPPAHPDRQHFLQLCRFRHPPCRKPSRTVAPTGSLYAPRKPPKSYKSAAPKAASRDIRPAYPITNKKANPCQANSRNSYHCWTSPSSA
ncbi:hypothetical protein E8E68_21515 [Pseudomonas sp. BN607]|nr:hypothetical protein [Pseudomonas sp. BN607]